MNAVAEESDAVDELLVERDASLTSFSALALSMLPLWRRRLWLPRSTATQLLCTQPNVRFGSRGPLSQMGMRPRPKKTSAAP